MRTYMILLALGVVLMAVGSIGLAPQSVDAAGTQGYLVVFDGDQTADGFDMTLDQQSAIALVESAGGTVLADLTAQIGVAIVETSDALFADVLRDSTFVTDVGENYTWKAFQTYDEAVSAGAVADVEAAGDGGSDPLASLQWDMQMIRASAAHEVQAGRRAVDVGILDTGIDATHADFLDPTGDLSNVDCARGRDFIPLGPGVGTPAPCSDNGFHGTHVAGTVAAQANGVGMVGVAPGVTLVPVKVCDSSGYCYASSVIAGITYAGDAKLDVINMSFFVDNDALLESTEFKCNDDPQQRTFRRAVERAISYARGQGVTPVAALGNSDTDLAHSPSGNNCDVVPAETSGVVGTMALGSDSEKASYSNYGSGATDIAAPGGNGTTGDCTTTIFSTFPGNAYGCIQGTSMASPHAAGVAALIVSQFGTIGDDGDVEMPPTKVEAYLSGTAVDIGLDGYDECFGNGRIDAVRAVQHDTSALDDEVPFCPEYSQ